MKIPRNKFHKNNKHRLCNTIKLPVSNTNTLPVSNTNTNSNTLPVSNKFKFSFFYYANLMSIITSEKCTHKKELDLHTSINKEHNDNIYKSETDLYTPINDKNDKFTIE